MANVTHRISQVARKLNVGRNTILEFLASKGYEIDKNPNAKIDDEQYELLSKEYADSAHDKEEASSLTIGSKPEDVIIKTNEEPKKKTEEEILIQDNVQNTPPPPPQEIESPPTENIEPPAPKNKLQGPKIIGQIDLSPTKKTAPKDSAVQPPSEIEQPPKTSPDNETVEENIETEEPKKEEKTDSETLKGLTVVGKIDLPKKSTKKPIASSDINQERKKRPRKRLSSENDNRKGSAKGKTQQKKTPKTEELSDKEIQDKIKNRIAKFEQSQQNPQKSKFKKEKRIAKAEAEEEKLIHEEEEAKKLNVTEFISAGDLASLMDVSVSEVVSTCMTLGMIVSINQRMDAETIEIIAEEFGFKVVFTTSENEDDKEGSENEDEANLEERAPIVTIMGHVDHGKTSLLDFIRKANVTKGEAGGITQHIGAYDVTTLNQKRIAFLDTPGHEAFTAMRARGAKLTDIVVIVIAADDSVMPTTKEAINHAKVAEVPMVIALNKIDKPNANPEKIYQELASMDIIVEEWNGKYQCQSVSAITGEGVDKLLEKILLEAELMELKANPNKPAVGTIVEASLDKGRGYVSTLMVQSGTLKVGDIVLASSYYGRVKAMFNHQGKKLQTAGPSTPVQMLGLDGAPQAGDKFSVMESDSDARTKATERGKILREQNIRIQKHKHITLEEVGRRLALGSFRELNVIVKGDVDGSVEALSDSFQKLSTEEIQVKIIQKGVGQISESDVLLASASDAIIVGFQVRPSANARKLAENEEIDIRLYSVIYNAINELKSAMEGLLAPKTEEQITGNIEVREIFKVPKVGTVAGCMVTDGIVKRANKVHVIRDGIVIYDGDINQLKRFKDDVKEVKSGFECGLSISNFNDIKIGDIIEGYETKEIKRTL